MWIRIQIEKFDADPEKNYRTDTGTCGCVSNSTSKMSDFCAVRGVVVAARSATLAAEMGIRIRFNLDPYLDQDKKLKCGSGFGSTSLIFTFGIPVPYFDDISP